MKVYPKEVREEVRDLRVQGFSLNEIHKEKGIPRTTIRGWIKDVVLTDSQRQKFKERTLEGLQKGRVKAQQLQEEIRQQKEKKYLREGIKDMQQISKRDLFIAAVALYWAEGFKNKYEHRLGFCNSDPLMIKFYLKWLDSLGVKKEDIILRLSLNKAYEKQVRTLEEYWSEFLNIPIEQFTKPFFQKSTWKKQYNTDSYKGVLRVHVKDSQNLLLKMRGWIEGLKMIK